MLIVKKGKIPHETSLLVWQICFHAIAARSDFNLSWIGWSNSVLSLIASSSISAPKQSSWSARQMQISYCDAKCCYFVFVTAFMSVPFSTTLSQRQNLLHKKLPSAYPHLKLSTAFTSAPFWINTFTISTRSSTILFSSWAARCSAVFFSALTAFIRAPFSSNTFQCQYVHLELRSEVPTLKLFLQHSRRQFSIKTFATSISFLSCDEVPINCLRQ